ncbi:MAG: hypothetical protein J6C96_12180 [Oscillospiraceae bacterium]|nr:hypothetical protein [Oscillospiraceae bacterium]
MKNPFNFRIDISDGERVRRRKAYALTAVVLTVTFTVGFIIVYVNSYNIMHTAPLEVFGFYRTAEGIGVVLFGHFFQLFA